MNAKEVLEAIIHSLHSQQNKKLLFVVYLLLTRFKVVGYAYLGNQIRLVLLTPCYCVTKYDPRESLIQTLD